MSIIHTDNTTGSVHICATLRSMVACVIPFWDGARGRAYSPLEMWLMKPRPCAAKKAGVSPASLVE